jgi:hypothetical protein
MTSRPFTIGLMALCWIAEGFSKPAKLIIVDKLQTSFFW